MGHGAPGLPIHAEPVRVYYPPIAERTSRYRRFVDTVRIIFLVVIDRRLPAMESAVAVSD